MSRRLDDTWTNWTTPLNLGRTINSSGDDNFYVIPAKGDFIYFSSDRDGYGKDDIFRIGLPMEMRPKPVAVIKGSVLNKKDNTPVLAKVNYEDLETGIQLGSVNTNPATGEYQIILVSGKKYGITPIPITEMSIESTMSGNAKSGSGESFESASMNKERISKENTSGKSGNTNKINNGNIINSTTVIQSNVSLEGISDNDLKVSNTNKNYPKLFAESQNIDLTDLKEYTVIEQKLLVVPVESGQTISLNNLFFETASWVLKKESSIELNRVVKILTENPSIKIEIGGHTDDKGSDETNKTLSEKRAFEVYSYLITKSISKERLIYVGYGESKPKVPNTTESNRATNRRVELKIR
jgi:outer membrane protein OmpA-like peptidoglycan-associated protein